MALEIGAGIALGGGISLTVESGGGGGGGEGNLGSITVVDHPYNDGMGITHYYGASAMTGTTIGTFGSVTGGTLRVNYADSYGGRTEVYLTDGTYSGFTVSNGGCINGDTSSTQTFTIGGISYSLTPQNAGNIYRYWVQFTDAFSLATKVGQTLAVDVTV